MALLQLWILFLILLVSPLLIWLLLVDCIVLSLWGWMCPALTLKLTPMLLFTYALVKRLSWSSSWQSLEPHEEGLWLTHKLSVPVPLWLHVVHYLFFRSVATAMLCKCFFVVRCLFSENVSIILGADSYPRCHEYLAPPPWYYSYSVRDI